MKKHLSCLVSVLVLLSVPGLITGCSSQIDTAQQSDVYEGLPATQWEAMQAAKEEFNALSEQQQQEILEGDTLEYCRNFQHLRWEENFSNALIKYVGSYKFQKWIEGRASEELCPDIYAFMDSFEMDMEKMETLLRDNKQEEFYPLETMQTRYAYFHGGD
jgi:uncharacterized protein YuzB (UPF0349 family)